MIRTDLIAPVGVLLRRHASERGTKVAFEDSQNGMRAAVAAGTAPRARHPTVSIGHDCIAFKFFLSRSGAPRPLSLHATRTESMIAHVQASSSPGAIRST